MLPNSPGSRRFLADLLDYADVHEGAFPATKLLSKYTAEEAEEVRASLKRHQHGMRDGVTLVHVSRLIEDSGSAEVFRLAASKALGRAPRDLVGQARRELEELRECIIATGLSGPETSDLLALVREKPRGWLGRSLRQDGLTKTLERIRTYATVLGGLPLPEQEPVRQYLSRVLKDSHALDNDSLLEGALRRRILARNPDYDDVDDAFLAEGLQRRIANGSTIVQGSLHFDGLSVPAGCAFALTEEFLAKHRLVAPLPKVVLSIENPSTWQSLRQLPPATLLVLTDGFPTKATQHLIRSLASAGVQVWHWGDVDDGGYRILATLQRGGNVNPWLMDEGTVHRYRDRLTAFTSAKPRLRGQAPALRAAQQLGGWLEQESIPLSDALSTWPPRPPFHPAP